MAILDSKIGRYENPDVIENMIRYLTRTRRNENRQGELIGYAGYGFSFGNNISVEQIIYQFESVQQVYDIDRRGGKRCLHEVLSFSIVERENLAYWPNLIWMIASECAKYYYSRGFQTLYAIHNGSHASGAGLHIHFMVNYINFNDGRKFHSSKGDLKDRKRIFQGIVDNITIGGSYYLPKVCVCYDC